MGPLRVGLGVRGFPAIVIQGALKTIPEMGGKAETEQQRQNSHSEPLKVFNIRMILLKK